VLELEWKGWGDTNCLQNRKTETRGKKLEKNRFPIKFPHSFSTNLNLVLFSSVSSRRQNGPRLPWMQASASALLWEVTKIRSVVSYRHFGDNVLAETLHLLETNFNIILSTVSRSFEWCRIFRFSEHTFWTVWRLKMGPIGWTETSVIINPRCVTSQKIEYLGICLLCFTRRKCDWSLLLVLFPGWAV
jgi:hypothetical protein